MGSKTRKVQCSTLYVGDSNKEERSIKLRSILRVLPRSILRIWRLRARTKNECTMDDFSMLTIREPWLLKRKVSTAIVSTWLAGKGIDAARLLRFMTWYQLDRTFQTSITRKKGKLIKELPYFLVRVTALCGNFRIALPTPWLISQFGALAIPDFESAILFKVDAMRMLVRYGAHDAHWNDSITHVR
jgi:hypothetical protein